MATILDEVVAATKRQLEPSQFSPQQKRMKTEIITPLSDSSWWNIPVPISKESLRSIFYEGKFSLKENLPHPTVHTNVKDHVYLLPSECVADSMAHQVLDGRDTPTNSCRSLSKNSLAIKIHQQNTMHGIRSIFLSLWCDDFEPNYQKSNRGSVWVMTLTIKCPTSGVPTVEHVYPIAVGPKKSDHYDLMEVIWKDILSLKNDGIH